MVTSVKGRGADSQNERPSFPFDPRSSWLPLAVPAPGAAPWAAIPFDAGLADRGPRAYRLARRLVRSLAVGVRAARAARALRRDGWDRVGVVRWDVGRALARGPARHLALGATVVGRGDGDASAAEAALAAAAVERPERVLLQEGCLVAFGSESVVRIAHRSAGAACIEAQVRTLELLAAAPAVVRDRVPLVVAHGEIGPVSWSAERRLPGVRPARVDAALVEQCTEFLAALHGVDGGPADARGPADDAALVASFAPDDRLHRIGAVAEERLGHVPRGFGHGDFSPANLLVDGERLSGVVDWDRAGAGRLPLLDLLWLRGGHGGHVGRVVLEELVPWCACGDPASDALAARLGFEPTPPVREALVAAFWLDRVAFELRTYADRPARRDWMHANVSYVLPGLARLF